MKPSKSIAEVDVKSVRKKLKDKAFARSVSRDDIENGAAELGVDLDEHIEFCIRRDAVRELQEIGLAGTTMPPARMVTEDNLGWCPGRSSKPFGGS